MKAKKYYRKLIYIIKGAKKINKYSIMVFMEKDIEVKKGVNKVNIYQNMNTMKMAMDGAMLRDEVLSQNLANVNTPDYKRSDVNFQAELRKAITGDGRLELARTNTSHISNRAGLSGYSPRVETEKNISRRRDGSGVSLDQEMAEKSKNAIIYNALIGQVSRQLNSLKTAIAEGGK